MRQIYVPIYSEIDRKYTRIFIRLFEYEYEYEYIGKMMLSFSSTMHHI